MGCELIRSDLSAGDALLGAVEGGGGGAGDVLRMEGFVDGLFGGRVDGAAWFFARVRGVRRVWGGSEMVCVHYGGAWAVLVGLMGRGVEVGMGVMWGRGSVRWGNVVGVAYRKGLF